MLGTLESILNRIEADYADIRYERKNELHISFSGRELSELTPSGGSGFVLRVLSGGGFSSVPFTREDEAEEAIRKAMKNAALLGRERKVRLKQTDPVKGEFLPPMRTDPADLPIEEKIGLLRDYNEIALSGREVTTTSSSYSEVDRDRSFMSTEGTEIRERLVTTKVAIEVVCREGTNVQSTVAGRGSGNGIDSLKNLEGVIEEKTRRAAELLRAKPVKGGKQDVLANPVLAGTFAHEAFGHFSEADLVEDMPFLRERMKLGEKLGSDELSITSDPTMDGTGFYRWDDEGVPAKRVQLMKNGVLSGRLHSRRTAAEFDEPLTGHCIAEDYRYAPIIRMGNIYIEAGDWSREELLEELRNGLYLLDFRGGQTMGEQFTFSAGYGYEVRNGEIGEMVRDANLMGNLFETLKNIKALGRDVEFETLGTCGKGQSNIRSPMGAPHTMIRDALVGGGR